MLTNDLLYVTAEEVDHYVICINMLPCSFCSFYDHCSYSLHMLSLSHQISSSLSV